MGSRCGSPFIARPSQLVETYRTDPTIVGHGHDPDGTFVRWRRSSSRSGRQQATTLVHPIAHRGRRRLARAGCARPHDQRQGRRRSVDSLMTLTTLDPPVVGFVSIWTQQSYGPHVLDALERLADECDRVDAYLVTESVPLPPPPTAAGARTPGFANVALLRRPTTWTRKPGSRVGMSTTRRWRSRRSRRSATPRTQSCAPLTSGAPVIDAIVEELFPIEATRDLHAFFGAADDDDLSDRMNRMVASTSAFGANQDVDTVPTSRYVLRSPFAEEVSPMTTLDEAVGLAAAESGLAVVSTVRGDGTVQASLVNAGAFATSRDREMQALGVRHLRQGEVGQPAGATPDRRDVPRRVAVGDRRGHRRTRRPRRPAAVADRRRPAPPAARRIHRRGRKRTTTGPNTTG